MHSIEYDRARVHLSTTATPARLIDLGDGEYSYTDPASMFRDMERTWRRPHNRSLEHSSRPTSMTEGRLARISTREPGPPPSVRGFDKIYNSTPRYHVRYSSIDRSYEIPKYGPHPGRVTTGSNNKKVQDDEGLVSDPMTKEPHLIKSINEPSEIESSTTTTMSVVIPEQPSAPPQAALDEVPDSLLVRFELPFTIACDHCPSPTVVPQGTQFIAEKRRVGNYRTTPIWSFSITHNVCDGKWEIRTNPGKSEFFIVKGARKQDSNMYDDVVDVQWGHIPYGTTRQHSPSGLSGPSSYANSVFSTASLVSSATDLSKTSGYSPVQIARATKELIMVLQEDTDLVPLYKRALVDSSIGPVRLERNLRRFFKSYASLLGDDAKDNLDLLASRLVKIKARAVAQSIVQKYNPDSTEQFKVTRIEQEQEQSSDEEIETNPVDESIFDDLIVFREFLVSGEAFSTLQVQIRSFVLPKSVRQKTTENFIKDVVGAQAIMDNFDGAPKIGETCAVMSKEHAIPVDSTTGFSVFRTMTRGLTDSVQAVLVGMRYLEPPLQQGFVRLRWQCVSINPYYLTTFIIERLRVPICFPSNRSTSLRSMESIDLYGQFPHTLGVYKVGGAKSAATCPE
jgi:hypothetical protein